MTSVKLSSQDRKDLDKFTKYLVYKCIQVIVQSRLGDKARSQSKSFSSGSDWFNLTIRDLPEVFSETKKVFSTGLLEKGQYVCIEMSLRTVEGETMVLETWSIGMFEQTDPNARVSYTVYNRMGILLKSLICVSRVTPTYRLSRKQGADTYVICYRVYKGEPQVQHLGEGFQSLRVGAVPTPAGTIGLQVRYRTKMLISPQPCSRDLSIDLKDDHFMPDLSPRKANLPRPCMTAHRNRRHSASDEGPTCLESECCATMFSTSPPDNSPGFPLGQGGFMTGTPPHRLHAQRRLNIDDANHAQNCPDKVPERVPSFSAGLKMGAFAPFRENVEQANDMDDIPFMALLQQQQQAAAAAAAAADNDRPPCSCQPNQNQDCNDGHPEAMDQNSRSTGSSNKSGSSQASMHDDFVMVELKTPFAGTDANTDLGRFYRECQVAPTLSMFKDDTENVDETLNAITNQLAMFEANAPSYDDFVTTLEGVDS